MPSKPDACLQILMTSFKSTPGVVAANEANVQELMIVREFYELGCLVSAQSEDIEGFERHFAVVKSCYTDYAGVLPQSEKQYELQGLNLLCLLAQSKIAEFHTELELIPVSGHRAINLLCLTCSSGGRLGEPVHQVSDQFRAVSDGRKLSKSSGVSGWRTFQVIFIFRAIAFRNSPRLDSGEQ